VWRWLRARAAATLEDILAAANAGPGKGEKGLIVLLDGVRIRTIWGANHSHGAGCGCKWRGGSGAASGGIDGHGCAGFGGGAVAHARG